MAVMLCTWIVTTIPAFVHALVIKPSRDKQLTDRYYVTANSILLTFMAVVFIMIVSTYKDICKSLPERHAIKISNISSGRIRALKVVENRRKVAKILLIMSVVYFVTIIPQIFGSIVIDTIFSKREERIRSISKPSFHLVYIVSSVINPVLTVLCKADYKKTIFGKPRLRLRSNLRVGQA